MKKYKIRWRKDKMKFTWNKIQFIRGDDFNHYHSHPKGVFLRYDDCTDDSKWVATLCFGVVGKGETAEKALNDMLWQIVKLREALELFAFLSPED